MTTYQVGVSVTIHPIPDEGRDYSTGNSLYHSQTFKISGEKFSDIAPTIDGIYHAVQTVVEANGGHSY